MTTSTLLRLKFKKVTDNKLAIFIKHMDESLRGGLCLGGFLDNKYAIHSSEEPKAFHDIIYLNGNITHKDLDDETPMLIKFDSEKELDDYVKGMKKVEEDINNNYHGGVAMVNYEDKEDIVNNPPHYKSGRFEVIDIIEEFDLNYHIGNVTKYILRAGKKDKNKELEDFKKARWYLDRHISKLEEE